MDALKQARERYEKGLDCHDELAELLRGVEPAVVARVTDHVLLNNPLWRGDGTGKYDQLNLGQVRMTSGDLLLNAIRRGDISLENIRRVL